MPGLRSLRPDATVKFEDHLVWMLASPRSGTTWLLNLLGCHPAIDVLDEPLIGAHLGVSNAAAVGLDELDRSSNTRIYDTAAGRRSYFFSDEYRATWQPLLRQLILERFRAELTAPSNYLVVKEPHGTEAADLLLQTTPKSKMLFVVRDGRDCVDSAIDAVAPGAWGARDGALPETAAARQAFLADQSYAWVERLSVVMKAYDAHDPSDRLLVRYEDLRVDTETGYRKILAWLGLEFVPRLSDVIEALSYEKIPADKKGAGKFIRTAQPGLWQQNFSADEQVILNDVMGTTLSALGYHV